ncbi:MAG: hypothetical protein HQM16_14860 [Deltaproteobacteria bacterium]|nr:hypothetical protein [Deltaproteobacteria bacterium]
MADQGQTDQSGQKRKFIGVNFTCCGVYARIYLNKAKNAYIGNCPKCLKRVNVEVNKEKATTDSRFFNAR